MSRSRLENRSGGEFSAVLATLNLLRVIDPRSEPVGDGGSVRMNPTAQRPRIVH